MTSPAVSIKWVRQGVLARSPRPGWPEELPSGESIEKWTDEAATLGIKSIICLLSKVELDEMYGHQGIDLLKCYRKKHFLVKHIPLRDYAIPPLNESQVTIFLTAFKRLRKPVLVHCSAGMDRTGAAIHALNSSLD